MFYMILQSPSFDSECRTLGISFEVVDDFTYQNYHLVGELASKTAYDVPGTKELNYFSESHGKLGITLLFKGQQIQMQSIRRVIEISKLPPLLPFKSEHSFSQKPTPRRHKITEKPNGTPFLPGFEA